MLNYRIRFKTLVILLFACVGIGALSSEDDPSCVYQDGDDASAPWTATINFGIGNQDKHFSPGAILNAHTVITYGRSFVGIGNKLNILPFENYTVYVGPTEYKVYPSHPIQVSYVKPHPDLQRDGLATYWMTNRNDFVLLHLKTPIPDEFLKTACLPEATNWDELWPLVLTPNTTNLVGGWKRGRDLDPVTNELVIHDRDYCESLWKTDSETKDYSFTDRICAFPNAAPTIDNPHRECFTRDSGVVLKHPTKKRYFLGFVNTYFNSEGYCGPNANHTISLAPPSVLAWVRQNIACGHLKYACHNGECVSVDAICDQKPDCTDGSDEDKKYCRGRNYCQPNTEFECGTHGECIPIRSESGKLAANCDGVPDCSSGEDEDEETCGIKSEPPPLNKSLVGVLAGVALVALSLLPISYFLWRRFGPVYRPMTDDEIVEFLHGHPEIDDDPNNPLIDIRRLSYNTSFECDPMKLGGELGRGQFGIVHWAKLNGQIVAVKLPRVGRITIDAFITLLNELKIMQYIQMNEGHENIVKFIGAYTKKIKSHVLQIAMEYCQLGSLKKYLIAYKQYFRTDVDLYIQKHLAFATPGYVPAEIFHAFSPLDMVRWCQQIARGMAFLKSKRLIHGDLTARNVLLGDNRTPKISDFGLARQSYLFDQYVTNKERGFPWNSTAPEVQESNGRNHNIKSDVYSFGILMWEIFSFGATPLIEWEKRVQTPEFLQHLKSGAVLEKPEHADDRLYDLMLNCWQPNPDDRPEFDQLVNSLEALYNEMDARAVLVCASQLQGQSLQPKHAASEVSFIHEWDSGSSVHTSHSHYM